MGYGYTFGQIIDILQPGQEAKMIDVPFSIYCDKGGNLRSKTDRLILNCHHLNKNAKWVILSKKITPLEAVKAIIEGKKVKHVGDTFDIVIDGKLSGGTFDCDRLKKGQWYLLHDEEQSDDF